MTPQQMTPFQPDAANGARTAFRHVTRSVRCNLGPVLDLSTAGMRLLSDRVPRSPVDVELYAMNKSVAVRGRIAWSQPTGSAFRKEVGIVFGKLTRAQREMIESLARGRSHHSIL